MRARAEAAFGLGHGGGRGVARALELGARAGEVVLELALDLGRAGRLALVVGAREEPGERLHAPPSAGRSTPAIASETRVHSRSRSRSSRRPARESA